MKYQKLAIVVFASIAIPATALAEDFCGVEIGALVDELLIGGICDATTNPVSGLELHRNFTRICEGLVSKAEGAAEKLASEKLIQRKKDQAIEKLESFDGTMSKLLSKDIITQPEWSGVNATWLVAFTCANAVVIP